MVKIKCYVLKILKVYYDWKVELLNFYIYLEFLESIVNYFIDMINIKLNYYILVLMLKMLDLESLVYWV